MASTATLPASTQNHAGGDFASGKRARIVDKDEQIALFLETQAELGTERQTTNKESSSANLHETPASESTMTASTATASATSGAALFAKASVSQPLREILRRLRRYEIARDYCIYAGLVFVHRYLQTRQCVLTNDNVRPLFVVAVMLGSKFLDDVTYNSATFASLAGIPLQTLNALEMDMLHALDFNCCVAAHHVNTVAAHIRALFE